MFGEIHLYYTIAVLTILTQTIFSNDYGYYDDVTEEIRPGKKHSYIPNIVFLVIQNYCN